MKLIQEALPQTTGIALPEIPIMVERRTLVKRLWRTLASDGAEIGFELHGPLKHRDVVWVTEAARYVIRQIPEDVLEVSLNLTPEQAVAAGWLAGNLHCPVEVQEGRMLAADEKALRLAFDRAGIRYREACEVFQPTGHLARAGHGHSHGADGEVVRAVGQMLDNTKGRNA